MQLIIFKQLQLIIKEKLMRLFMTVQEQFLLKYCTFSMIEMLTIFFRFFYTVGIPGTNYILSATPECHWTEFHFPPQKPLDTPVLYRKMCQILPSPVPDQLSAQTLDLTEKMQCNPGCNTKNINTRGARPREVRSRETWISGYRALGPKLPLIRLKFTEWKV